MFKLFKTDEEAYIDNLIKDISKKHNILESVLRTTCMMPFDTGYCKNKCQFDNSKDVFIELKKYKFDEIDFVKDVVRIKNNNHIYTIRPSMIFKHSEDQDIIIYICRCGDEDIYRVRAKKIKEILHIIKNTENYIHMLESETLRLKIK